MTFQDAKTDELKSEEILCSYIIYIPEIPDQVRLYTGLKPRIQHKHGPTNHVLGNIISLTPIEDEYDHFLVLAKSFLSLNLSLNWTS